METKVIKPLLRSLFISYALSALFLGALAFALYKLRLGESLVNLLIFAVYFAACFAGGFFTGRKVRNRRFFWGLTLGLVYFLVLLAVSFLLNKGLNGTMNQILTTMAICAASGTIGGMIS